MNPRLVPDPLYTAASIDGTPGVIYLPNAYVRQQAEVLAKAQKQSGGKIFSEYHGYSTQTGYGPGLDKSLDGLSFALLRQLADTSPIDRLIIDTRIMQVKRVARRALGRDAIGFAVRHMRDKDPDFDVPEQLDAMCRELEDLLSSPTAPYHQHIQDFLTVAVDEELTIDRKAMAMTRDRLGRPRGFYLLDGASIKPVPLVIFERIQREFNKAPDQQILSYSVAVEYIYKEQGFDLTDKAYVQLSDAKIVGAWTDDEMSIDITNPSVRMNQWGYGRSLLEKSYRLSDAFMRAWNYNTELFKLNYPEAILAVKGSVSPEGLQAFKRKVLGEGNGQDNNWRLPVIPSDDPEFQIESIKLRDTPKDMMFAEFMQAVVRLKCAAYRMHPSLINFSAESSAQGSLIIGPAQESDAISLAQEEGFHGLLDSLADWLTRTIVKEYNKDLRLVWLGLDRETEQSRIELLVQKVQSVMTINEGRAELGLDPLPDAIPTSPGDFIGSYEQAVQIMQQEKQMAAQMGGPGYEQGDFGGGGQGAPGQPQQGPPAAPGAPKTGSDGVTPWYAKPAAAGSPPGQNQGASNQPQIGGPQHLDQEAQQLRRSQARALGSRSQARPRFLRIEVADEDDDDA